MNNENMLLVDLLRLTEDEINNSKIVLNMNTSSENRLDTWLKTNYVDFSYWSHQGSWKGDGHKKPNRNFHEGNMVFGFVQLGGDRWLLVTAGIIKHVPKITLDNPIGSHCSYDVVEKYKPLLGRLIIKLKKGNTFSRYAFNFSRYSNEAYVEQILPTIYGVETFPGYHNLNIGFEDLNMQIDNPEWSSKLSAVNGIYLIVDKSNNKKYVGAAYGNQGFYGRWKAYLNNGYDDSEEESGEKFPNSQLKKIAKDKTKGLEYIRKNFKFSILETIPSNIDNKYVIERENHWKEILNTRSKEYGYNSN
jgi:hypothetical protein